LESAGALEEARRRRSLALNSTDIARAGPLWRSEGEDLLHNKKDYRGALAAFQNAIKGLEATPALYGATRPDLVYAGAAQAALQAGERTIARSYTESFEKAVTHLAKNKSLNLQLQEKTLKWLRQELAKETSGGPSAEEKR